MYHLCIIVLCISVHCSMLSRTPALCCRLWCPVLYLALFFALLAFCLLNGVLTCSDGEVNRSEPVKLSTQLYRKKVQYSKLFKTCSCCGHLMVIKINNTFQSAVIHYSCWFHIWFYNLFLVLIYCIKIMAIVKVINLCRCTATKIIQINQT